MYRFFIHSFPHLSLFFDYYVGLAIYIATGNVQHVNFPERVLLDEKGWVVPGKFTNYRVAKQHSSLTLLYHSGNAVEYYVSPAHARDVLTRNRQNTDCRTRNILKTSAGCQKLRQRSLVSKHELKPKALTFILIHSHKSRWTCPRHPLSTF